MKKIALITTILLAVLTVASSTTVAEDGDRDAMMALYDSTDGANWTINAGWGVGNPCDSAWFGVTCDSGHVARLYLNNNQLNGPIPAELGNLGGLVELVLHTNQLSGPIPAELGNLSSLENINLRNTQLSGPIPAELGNMNSLQMLVMDNNQLSGHIPAALSNLSNLRILWLVDNPALECWQTQAALIWAQGLQSYGGPEVVCSYLLYLPEVSAGG